MNPEPNAADTTLNELSDKLTSVSLEPNEANNNETEAKNWARRVSEDEKLPKPIDSDSQNEDVDEAKETAAPSTNPNEAKPKRKQKRKDPAFIPRSGYYFEHDDREDDSPTKKDPTEASPPESKANLAENPPKETKPDENDAKSVKETDKKAPKPNFKSKTSNPNPRRKRFNGIGNNPKASESQNDEDRWTHDRFDVNEQQPKSRTEIVQRYGYDIREQANQADAELAKSKESTPAAQTTAKSSNGKFAKKNARNQRQNKPVNNSSYPKTNGGDDVRSRSAENNRNKFVQPRPQVKTQPKQANEPEKDSSRRASESNANDVSKKGVEDEEDDDLRAKLANLRRRKPKKVNNYESSNQTRYQEAETGDAYANGYANQSQFKKSFNEQPRNSNFNSNGTGNETKPNSFHANKEFHGYKEYNQQAKYTNNSSSKRYSSIRSQNQPFPNANSDYQPSVAYHQQNARQQANWESHHPAQSSQYNVEFQAAQQIQQIQPPPPGLAQPQMQSMASSNNGANNNGSMQRQFYYIANQYAPAQDQYAASMATVVVPANAIYYPNQMLNHNGSNPTPPPTFNHHHQPHQYTHYQQQQQQHRQSKAIPIINPHSWI